MIAFSLTINSPLRLTWRVIPEHISTPFHCSSFQVPWHVTAPSYSINQVLLIEQLSSVFSPTPILRVMWQFFCLRWASFPRFNLVVYWVELITILKAPNPTGQPARLEEQKSYRYLRTQSSQMAGPRTRRNPPLGGEDELAGAPTEGNSTPSPSPVVSQAQTPAPAQAPAPTPAPGPPGRYTDEDLQRATKLALESFVKGQEHGQLEANSALREQPLKARFSDLYYGNSHLDCYRFCQQCEDHFETAGANRLNRVLFAASFLRRAMIQQWHQQKRRSEAEDPIT